MDALIMLRNSSFHLVTLLLLTLTPIESKATWYPATEAKLLPNELEVTAESGETIPLQSLVPSTHKATLLVPTFFGCFERCVGSAHHLKETLNTSQLKSGFNVVFLSLDGGDGQKEMARYRAYHALPAEWRLAHVTSQSHSTDFLARYGFILRRDRAERVSPNLIAVLSSSDQRWLGSLSMQDFKGAELVDALEQDEALAARLIQEPEKRFAVHQRYFLWASLAGLTLSLCYPILIVSSKRRNLSHKHA